MILEKIVSGGQTGADRAGLDAAIACNMPHSGWCPANRWAEDGRIPDQYNLSPMISSKPIVRTRKNVATSDATVIFTYGPATKGSAATVRFCRELNKPHLVIDLNRQCDKTICEQLHEWLQRQYDSQLIPKPLILNVAGSRESTAPGIYSHVYRILTPVITYLCNNNDKTPPQPKPANQTQEEGIP